MQIGNLTVKNDDSRLKIYLEFHRIQIKQLKQIITNKLVSNFVFINNIKFVLYRKHKSL